MSYGTGGELMMQILLRLLLLNFIWIALAALVLIPIGLHFIANPEIDRDLDVVSTLTAATLIVVGYVFAFRLILKSEKKS